MKKFLFILGILILNSNISLAANNLVNVEWWKTTTLDEVKSEIAKGADVNAKNDGGITALMAAVMAVTYFNKDPKIIETLIKAGADVNAKNNDGMTALMMSIMTNPNFEIAKILITSGADVNVGFGQGATFLATAMSGKFEIHALLLQVSDWKTYCKFVNNNSLEINYCIDRMQIYADKEDQLPSCVNNVPAMALISQYVDVFNKSIKNDKSKASRVYLGMADVAAKYNCSIGKTIKKIMGE